MKIIQFSLLFILSFLCIVPGCKTEPEDGGGEDEVVEHRKSPIVITSLSHEDTYIKIVYGQPYKRGRTIFGELEPYGQVWRTGANEATEITITEDIRMADRRIEAGTYALFTIPDPEEWTVILNTELGQWGAFTYDSQYDYVRFKVPLQKAEQIIEALNITFDDIDNGETSLAIAWDDSRIDIPIEFL